MYVLEYMPYFLIVIYYNCQRIYSCILNVIMFMVCIFQEAMLTLQDILRICHWNVQ